MSVAALSPLDIPTQLGELSPEWLTAALRSRGLLGKARIARVETEVLGVGEGFIGSLARLHLQLDAEESRAPRTLIAKLPTQNGANRAVGEALGLYEREVLFYQELAGEVRFAKPRCYYSAMDPHPLAGREQQLIDFGARAPYWVLRLLVPFSWWLAARSKRRYVLLLEDLAPASVGDQVAGCSVAEAEEIVCALAGAQAAMWNSPLFDRYWITRIDPLARVSRIMFRRNQHEFFRSFADQATDRVRELARWFETHDVAMMNRLGQPPLTLQHGDFRLDNLFLGGGVQVAAVDWQGVGCARGPLDVAYFVSGNLPIEAAADAEGPLLRAYHEALIAGGVSDYDFDACRRDYDLSKLYVLYRWMTGSHLLDMSHERGQLLMDRLLRRLIALLPEGDPAALL